MQQGSAGKEDGSSGSFLADHVRVVTLSGGTGGGGTPKHVKVEGEHQGERAERGRPCLRAGLFGVVVV